MVSVHLTEDSESAIVQEIAKHLQILMHLENESAYYWEIRRVHVNKKVGNPTRMVMVYFGCIQEERQFSRSNGAMNQLNVSARLDQLLNVIHVRVA